MGRYVNGGDNECGFALTESWAGLWTVDTPYITVIRRDFYDEHSADILEAVRLGQGFSDADGQTGEVAVIGTRGDLDETGWPKGFDDASKYVADELESWTRSDGGEYEQAVADGYTR